MNEEEAEYIQQLENRVAEQQQAQTQGFGMTEQQQQNLIEWQLDFKKEIVDYERLLRRQRVIIDENGEEKWIEPPDDERVLNERGVQEILRLLRIYLSKSILLSNFDQDMINMRCKQFGNALRRLIYLNYKQFGMDTEYRRKHYEIIWLEAVNLVEAAYHRAYKAGERESIRTVRQVTQTQPLGVAGVGGGQVSSPSVLPKQSKWFKPWSW